MCWDRSFWQTFVQSLLPYRATASRIIYLAKERTATSSSSLVQTTESILNLSERLLSDDIEKMQIKYQAIIIQRKTLLSGFTSFTTCYITGMDHPWNDKKQRRSADSKSDGMRIPRLFCTTYRTHCFVGSNDVSYWFSKEGTHHISSVAISSIHSHLPNRIPPLLFH